MSTEREWEEMFAEVGAFWRHDGNPARPYARLTSGRISNGFFNGTKVAEDGHLFGLTCAALWRIADSMLVSGKELRVVGAAVGGIALATRIAEAGKCKSAFAEKVDDRLEFRRFDLSSDHRFLMVEDTITTGGTLQKLSSAVALACPNEYPYMNLILAICNRSGKSEMGGARILSLISPSFEVWEEGENPFTPDGQELVPPVRPKENWTELVQNY